MALTKDYWINGDFHIPAAYLRILSVIIEYNPDKAGGGLKFIAKPFIQVHPAQGKKALEAWSADHWLFPYDQNSNTNVIKQAYQYLKTLPEFSGATDANE